MYTNEFMKNTLLINKNMSTTYTKVQQRTAANSSVNDNTNVNTSKQYATYVETNMKRVHTRIKKNNFQFT